MFKKCLISCLSIFMVFVLLLGSISQVEAVSNDNTVDFGDDLKNEFTEQFYDEDGHKINIEISVNEYGNEVYVYMDDILTQIARLDNNSGMISLQRFNSSDLCSRTVDVETYDLSTLVEDVDFFQNEVQIYPNNSIIQTNTNYMDGWTLYKIFPPSPILTNAKTCKLYYRNYDEEPDLHRYMGKKVTFNAGTAIGVVASVLATFLTGGVTIKAIVISLGATIISDAISQKISGEVCFSTQKIIYAPIVNDKYVWYDAYITKRWVISYDSIRHRESFELDNSCYDSNRGQTPENIAFNAQVATMSW